MKIDWPVFHYLYQTPKGHRFIVRWNYVGENIKYGATLEDFRQHCQEETVKWNGVTYLKEVTEADYLRYVNTPLGLDVGFLTYSLPVACVPDGVEI